MELGRNRTETLIVASPSRSRDFYRDILGGSVVAEEPTVVQLRLGEGTLELRQGPRPAPLPKDLRQIPPGGALIHVGVDCSLYLRTDDLERDVALLRSRGAELLPGRKNMAQVALRDPDDYPIELALMSPAQLSWRQATDRSRGYDPRDAEALARGVLAERLPRLPPEEPWRARFDAQHAIASWITRSLAARFGIWAVGWDWGRDHDGGPIASWCCSIDSMTTVAETAARVRSALQEWHDWIEELAATFSRHATGAGDDLSETLSRAAAELVARVGSRTAGNGGWYCHAIQVLSWYLESQGTPPARAQAIADVVAEGRFNSHEEPDLAVVADAARAFARETTRGDAPGAAQSDALATWLRTRASIDWSAFPELDVSSLSTLYQEEYVRFAPRRDDAERERFRAALARVRDDGARRAPLTWELVASWQADVLGSPVAFRTGSAFAKEGRERYGIGPDTRARYEAALAEALEPGVPLPARAARLYLDTCFFHPFPDGNARAAVLQVEYLLRRVGAAIGDGRAIAIPPRWAEDATSAKLLVGTIATAARVPWRPREG